MNISGPQAGSHAVRQYQAIPGAMAGIPRHARWMDMTKGGPRDSLLTRVDECLKLYEGPGDGWNRLALLGELYFCTNYYLKRAPGTGPKPQRETAMNDLFLTVVDQLCKSFDCTPNVLPEMLEECWGRVLTKHGHEVDTQQ